MATPKEEKSFHWPPLESNPQVFTEYLSKIGLSPTKFTISDIYGFDEELLALIPPPTHAVIAAIERNRSMDIQLGNPEDVSLVKFYMKQSGTLDNACGIIACLHSVLNSDDVTTGGGLEEDSILSKFMKQTESMSPEQRCEALENNKEFKEQHSEFAGRGQSEAVRSDQSKVKCHYVAFVVASGKLVELDGTKRGPRVICDCDDVLRGAVGEIKRKLDAGEITEQLNLMALGGGGGSD